MKVILKDKQTLEDEADRGNPVCGLELEVEEHFIISEIATTSSWYIFRIKDRPLICVKRNVDGKVDWFVYCKPDGFFCSKQELLDQGHSWLFSDDPFSKEIYQYDSLFNLNKHCECDVEIGIDNWTNGTITEWSTNTENINPHIICIVIEDRIEFYQGCQILENEIEFI